MCNFRAQRIKKRHKQAVKDTMKGKDTYLNIGRFYLEDYLKFCYKKYTELCWLCGETPKDFGKWLSEK